MFRFIVAAAIVCLAEPVWAAPDADKYLTSGQFAEGIVAFEAYLKETPKDDSARFGLGVIQFVQAVENLGQKLTAYEFRSSNLWNGPIEFPPQPQPQPKELLTYPLLRKFLQDWLDDLSRVNGTLHVIGDEEIKLPVHVGQVPLNLVTNRQLPLTLAPILRNMGLVAPGRDADFLITFDRADVDWMQGYCHILRAVAEMMLAYDGQGLFDVIAHRVFKHVKPPHEFLLEPSRSDNRGMFGDVEEIVDWIAAIHMTRFPVTEPKRMAAALSHLEQTLLLSRQMWKRVLSETDDDHEWIPNPNQKGAIRVHVSQRMIDNWLNAVDEIDAILQGKKLIPFWRGKQTRGINLRKVFLEPTQFDLVLWIQGTATIPYLEEGELTPFDRWRVFDEAFGGQLLGFGFWFN